MSEDVELRAECVRLANDVAAVRLVRFVFVAGPVSARLLCESCATDPSLPAKLALRGHEVLVRPSFREADAASTEARVLTLAASRDGVTGELGTLAARVFRPPRAKLADALAVVLGLDVSQVRPLVAGDGLWGWQASAHTLTWKRRAGEPPKIRLRATAQRVDDPCEAWEVLASRGIIPETWPDAPARRFVDLQDDTTQATPFRSVSPFPRTLREVVAFAADADAMTVVEALAREALARLAPWGGAVPQLFQWCHTRTAFFDRTLVPEPLRYLAFSQLDALRTQRLAEFRRAIRPYGYITREAEEAVVLALAWQDAVERDARVPASRAELRAEPLQPGWPRDNWPLAPPALRGQAFRALPDPFEPMVQILGQGCMLLDARPGAATLVLPPL